MSQGKLNGAGPTASDSMSGGDTTSTSTANSLGLLGSNYNKQSGIGQFGNPMGPSSGVSAPVAPDTSAMASGPVPQGNGPVDPMDDGMDKGIGY